MSWLAQTNDRTVDTTPQLKSHFNTIVTVFRRMTVKQGKNHISTRYLETGTSVVNQACPLVSDYEDRRICWTVNCSILASPPPPRPTSLSCLFQQGEIATLEHSFIQCCLTGNTSLLLVTSPKSLWKVYQRAIERRIPSQTGDLLD